MTIAQALVLVRRVGTVAEAGGKLKLAFPERMRPSLAQAIEALKANKAEALAQVAQLPPEELVEPAWTDWAERKAASLNRLFLEQGVIGRPGRITAATIRHGEASRAAGEAAPDRGKSIDPATGIRPMAEWGPECRRGFVSHERFARSAGEKVIARTPRARSKKPKAGKAAGRTR